MEFEENNHSDKIMAKQEAHASCLIIVDTSGAMGDKIASINAGISTFLEQLKADKKARETVDIAVISFGGSVNVVQEFSPAALIDSIPPLSADVGTPMGEALDKAITMVLERKYMYQTNGVESFIPQVVMFTASEPTDDIMFAKQRLNAENAKSTSGKGRIHLWTFAVQGADVSLLQSLTKRNLYATDSDYTKIFDWARKSLGLVSYSYRGQTFGDTQPQKLPEVWLRPETSQRDQVQLTPVEGAQTGVPADWLHNKGSSEVPTDWV